jgi:hypothetical protein
MPDAAESDNYARAASVITSAVNSGGQHLTTAGPRTLRVPSHPVPALTTYELRDYRRQLEHALADHVIGRAPIAGQLRETLAEVLAEEQSRVRLQQANGASR